MIDKLLIKQRLAMIVNFYEELKFLKTLPRESFFPYLSSCSPARAAIFFASRYSSFFKG